MEPMNKIQKYEERLENLPQVNGQILAEIAKYESLIDDQQNQLSIQDIKVKAMESELLKFDKNLEKTENQIEELTSTQEKNANKERRFMMQIDSYNKKIDTGKQEIAKSHKSIQLLKKDIKNLQSTIASVKSDKNKINQALTKEQRKINTLNQTLTDLKVKIKGDTLTSKSDTQKTSKNDPTELLNEIQRDQKQIHEIFNAIKKQIALIDILKRQKVHLIASTVFMHCEQEFEKCLEMNKEK